MEGRAATPAEGTAGNNPPGSPLLQPRDTAGSRSSPRTQRVRAGPRGGSLSPFQVTLGTASSEGLLPRLEGPGPPGGEGGNRAQRSR